MENQLLFLVFFVLFDVSCAVFLLESLYPAGGIDVFLLARIERVAHRTYLCVDFFCRAAGLEGIAAAAMNHNLIIFRVYPFFHKHNSQESQKLNYNNLGTSFNKNFSNSAS